MFALSSGESWRCMGVEDPQEKGPSYAAPMTTCLDPMKKTSLHFNRRNKSQSKIKHFMPPV